MFRTDLKSLQLLFGWVIYLKNDFDARDVPAIPIYKVEKQMGVRFQSFARKCSLGDSLARLYINLR